MVSHAGWICCAVSLLPVLLGSCGGSSADLQSPNPPARPTADPVADLTAGAIEAPSEVRLDSLLKLRIVVHNGGPRTAGPGWFIRVFLSLDPSIDSGDILIDQFVATRELPSGAEDRYLRNMKLPGRIHPGTYYLGSMLDVTHVVPETNEDNNTLRSPMTIRIMPKSSTSGDE